MPPYFSYWTYWAICFVALVFAAAIGYAIAGPLLAVIFAALYVIFEAAKAIRDSVAD
jgi:hypothetical protein